MATYPLRTAISDTYPNPSNAVARAGMGQLWDYTTSIPHGQCRLVKSGANLVLQRYNGQWLRINDAAYTIPSAGVSLAATGLTPSTTYNIYAYMSGATMTLEASTTAHSTDTTTGVEIKTGDATRTLVGMARVVTGPAWADTITQRFVLSWFNRRPINTQAALAASLATASTAPVELSTTLRNEFLTWGTDAVTFSFDGYASNNGATNTVASYLVIDGVLLEAYSVFQNSSVNQLGPVSVNGCNTPTEGYHYATPFVSVNVGTGTWIGSGTAGTRCSLKGLIWG